MKPLLSFWNALAERLNQRSTRERAILMLLVLGLFWFVFDTLWFHQHQQALQTLQASNQTQAQQLADVNTRLQLQRVLLQADVNASATRKKQQLQDDLAKQQEALLGAGQDLLGRDAVVALLARMLQARPGLETLSLKNLKPAPAVASAPATVLWRHPVELKVRGNYADIVKYLQQLEALQPRLHWQSLQLVNDTAPGHAYAVTATLVITTLSLEPQWLAL